MSMTITDDDLQSWEVYASGGDFGLPSNPKVVFHCLSDSLRRARYVEVSGDEADVQGLIQQSSEAELRSLLKQSLEMD